MTKRPSSKSQEENEEKIKQQENYEIIRITPPQSAVRKEAKDIYKCGDAQCGKIYHSYTAFYNHCKKSHSGQFPQNSIHNNKIFEGPTKNRGRPRIKKNQTKDEAQIESMKRQNELIEFLGTLKAKKNQELIVYVEDPLERMDSACAIVQEWFMKSQEINEDKISYLRELQKFNKLVAGNDLPQFYDPIQSELFKDKLDSYNFSSMYNFMSNPQKRQELSIHDQSQKLFYKILLVWLSRLLSQKLLSQVIYTVVQIEFNYDHFRQKDYLIGRSNQLREHCEKYFECFVAENEYEKQ